MPALTSRDRADPTLLHPIEQDVDLTSGMRDLTAWEASDGLSIFVKWEAAFFHIVMEFVPLGEWDPVNKSSENHQFP